MNIPMYSLMQNALAFLANSTMNYRSVMPITRKNIGRNHMKYGNSKYMPHQGKQEIARRLRQEARINERRQVPVA